ncbi:MAG: TIGR02147 family protein [Chitinivibrionales bacterium]|nr:TIGR02147 family protein [Chitinivibrionales bacterium]
MKSIYDYMDYREYLRDYYEEQKQKRPLSFSYRSLSRRIAIDSSYLAKVIAGKKHFSTALIPKISTFFKFSDKETHYFSLLMYYAKAKNEADRTYFLEQLSSSRAPSIEYFNLDKQQILYNWHPLVIWEMLHYVKIKDDPDELARRLVPDVSRQDAAKAIALLKELGFVEVQADGTLKALGKTLFVNRTTTSPAIHNLKKQVTTLALQALDRFANEELLSSYALVSLSDKSLEIIRGRVKALIKKIFKLAECEQKDRRVYQFAFHGFPVTIKDDGQAPND